MFFTRTPRLFKFLFKDIIWDIPDSDKVYLSFDDGPDPDSTPILLEFLQAQEIHASFFCTASKIERYPELYASILEHGHVVHNHGYGHKSAWNQSVSAFTEDVEKADRIIRSAYFRPPYGRMRPGHYLKLRKKYKIVMWSLMPGDFSDKRTEQDMMYIAENQLFPGDIVVLHDNADCLNKIKAFILQAKERSIEFGVFQQKNETLTH